MTPLSNPDRRDLDAEALDWFVRCGEQPTAELRAWLDADPAHRQAYERWTREWSQLDALPSAGVDGLRRQLAADKRQADKPRARGRAFWLAALSRWTPAISALMVGGMAYLAWSQWHTPPALYAETFVTARGEQRDVTLPDGSLLRLDTATRVEVKLYEKRRVVSIPDGQAVFQVQGDATRPFDVLAGPLKITVVGTRFSVRHTVGVPGDDGVRVAVDEGKVKVARAEGWGAYFAAAEVLTPGQQLSASADGDMAPVTPVASAGIAPWRDGMVSFNNTPLSQALAEFERYGATGLHVRNAAVGALRLTGTFDPRNLGNFKRNLPKVLPVQLLPQGDVMEIAPLS
ncbi:FecR family protein [Bordetella holmesii]|uniref:Sigma factor regulatory protein, FecR/PupR family n=2 Tax=Bordetella holmesii TaxID=35814 RepID=A0A158MAR0_9BORD|nr:FecR domain-containing protein [Bordetella holmesii]AHV91959.1 fecR family protein [Bordetella holmesii ATCC 51541]AIT26293.1 fecR family protein [Bordetella holmesii 44057]EWM43892.1 fecR family protein [Bordetella holmesii 41130]EWM46866.1 fecR family protein [Bordetella holmesii 35009]EWM51039.1 fecR family protein [Bordetella holmesii 70147]